MKPLYQLALDKWGKKAQLEKAVEEISEVYHELAIAVSQHNDFKAPENLAEIIDEICDCEIMLDQTCFIYGIRAGVEGRKVFKLRRLEERLNEN